MVVAGKNKMGNLNFLQEIPKDQYRTVKLSKTITATGYKSRRFEYSGDLINGECCINPEGVSLIIRTNDVLSANFELTIDNRTALLKLKEAINFALEIEEDAPS